MIYEVKYLYLFYHLLHNEIILDIKQKVRNGKKGSGVWYVRLDSIGKR